VRLFVNVVLAEIKLSFGSRKLDSPVYCKAEFVIGIGRILLSACKRGVIL